MITVVRDINSQRLTIINEWDIIFPKICFGGTVKFQCIIKFNIINIKVFQNKDYAF